MPADLIGTVEPDGRPTVGIRVEGRAQPLVSIVDTGFNGKIWVPSSVAEGPGFEPLGSEYVTLADGSVIEVVVATTTIDWFGRWEEVAVIAGGMGEPLIGTAMLVGCRLEVDFAVGSVRVTRAPAG